jgi:hypothetical protein|uniref:Uncharacterized protein n=1 Tax=viral metagenome TaxID=1070528 RepID=A0A6C0CLJ4_9ZZZZ
MNSEQFEHIKLFLNKCKIPFTHLNEIDGLLIPRETLLDLQTYDSVKDEISILKQIFNSSYLTSLQSTAEENQKWPLLNLVRQVLKSCHYKMSPKRVSAGYTKDGKKIFKRMFIIEKINQSSSSSVNSSTFNDSSSEITLSGSTSLN